MYGVGGALENCPTCGVALSPSGFGGMISDLLTATFHPTSMYCDGVESSDSPNCSGSTFVRYRCGVV